MDSCCSTKKRRDYVLFATFVVVVCSYTLHLLGGGTTDLITTFSHHVYEFINQMWWGIALGIIFVGLLDRIPQSWIFSLLGRSGTLQGVLRATGAGVLFDLCSHGILMVGMKLYQRGASIGQVVAFLVASPWNSLSLTVILWSLIGWQWTILFIVVSCVIAIISGLIFDSFVAKGVLPKNPNSNSNPNPNPTPHISVLTPISIIINGIRGSKMVIKWLLIGVIMAAALRTLLSPEVFAFHFGPTLAGLFLTSVIATIIEVCSEGSVPLAADIFTRARAPGNAFAFLMTGVSTDYTEIMSLKETTTSWKIALFLPLITVPQVITIALLLNLYA